MGDQPSDPADDDLIALRRTERFIAAGMALVGAVCGSASTAAGAHWLAVSFFAMAAASAWLAVSTHQRLKRAEGRQ